MWGNSFFLISFRALFIFSASSKFSSNNLEKRFAGSFVVKALSIQCTGNTFFSGLQHSGCIKWFKK